MDTANQTSVPGLYAVGETASTGVHGANRLASNSLLECVVYASQLAKLQPNALTEIAPASIKEITDNWSTEMESVNSIAQQLPELMWQSAGICRTADVMTQAIVKVEAWRQQMQSSPLYQFIHLSPGDRLKFAHPQAESQLKHYAETLNLLDIGYLILRSAAFRTESRGGHYRLDYPHTSPDWEQHTLIQQEQWSKAPVRQG